MRACCMIWGSGNLQVHAVAAGRYSPHCTSWVDRPARRPVAKAGKHHQPPLKSTQPLCWCCAAAGRHGYQSSPQVSAAVTSPILMLSTTQCSHCCHPTLSAGQSNEIKVSTDVTPPSVGRYLTACRMPSPARKQDANCRPTLSAMK